VVIITMLMAIMARPATRTRFLTSPRRRIKIRADILTSAKVGVYMSPLTKIQKTPRLLGTFGGTSRS